jgi:hypothetical protein
MRGGKGSPKLDKKTTIGPLRNPKGGDWQIRKIVWEKLRIFLKNQLENLIIGFSI